MENYDVVDLSLDVPKIPRTATGEILVDQIRPFSSPPVAVFQVENW